MQCASLARQWHSSDVIHSLYTNNVFITSDELFGIWEAMAVTMQLDRQVHDNSNMG